MYNNNRQGYKSRNHQTNLNIGTIIGVATVLRNIFGQEENRRDNERQTPRPETANGAERRRRESNNVPGPFPTGNRQEMSLGRREDRRHTPQRVERLRDDPIPQLNFDLSLDITLPVIVTSTPNNRRRRVSLEIGVSPINERDGEGFVGQMDYDMEDVFNNRTFVVRRNESESRMATAIDQTIRRDYSFAANRTMRLGNVSLDLQTAMEGSMENPLVLEEKRIRKRRKLLKMDPRAKKYKYI